MVTWRSSFHWPPVKDCVPRGLARMPQLPGAVEVWEWEVVRASDFCLAGISLQGGGVLPCSGPPHCGAP